MRSILLALAFIAPAAAFAATPVAAPADYTSPIVSIHSTKPQQVMLAFQNNAAQDRILLVGDNQFRLRPGQSVSTVAAVGTVVRMFCPQNSKINGQALLQVTATDSHRFITIS
jgi:hypothetical protein